MPRPGHSTVVTRIGGLVCAAIAGGGVAFALRGGLRERSAPREIRTTEIIGAVAAPLAAAAVLVLLVAVFDLAWRRRR